MGSEELATGIYERIQFTCTQKGISIYALEKKAGLTRNSIHAWKNSIPSADKILRVANCLDVSTDYLLSNTENPLSHKTIAAPEAILLLGAYEKLQLPKNLVELTISFMEWIKEKWCDE